MEEILGALQHGFAMFAQRPLRTKRRLAGRCRGRFAPALRGGGFQSAWLLGASRRTTTRINRTSPVQNGVLSGLAGYPPPR